MVAQESLTARRPGCVDIEQAWLEEAQRRSQELDGGTAEAIPSEVALANARAELSAAIELYHAMDMTFWLPQAEAALAEVQ